MSVVLCIFLKSFYCIFYVDLCCLLLAKKLIIAGRMAMIAVDDSGLQADFTTAPVDCLGLRAAA